jgi:hypothetical protein
MMAMGMHYGIRRPLKKRDDLFLLKDLKSNDIALIYALALADSKDESTILDEEAVFKIAEEYANGGIMMLLDSRKKTPQGEFSKLIERQILESED